VGNSTHLALSAPLAGLSITISQNQEIASPVSQRTLPLGENTGLLTQQSVRCVSFSGQNVFYFNLLNQSPQIVATNLARNLHFSYLLFFDGCLYIGSPH
jgi:hypothetical protein